jgi:hypothetical protein
MVNAPLEGRAEDHRRLQLRLVLGFRAAHDLDALGVGGIYFNLCLLEPDPIRRLSCVTLLGVKFDEPVLNLDEQCMIVVCHHRISWGRERAVVPARSPSQ